MEQSYYHYFTRSTVRKKVYFMIYAATGKNSVYRCGLDTVPEEEFQKYPRLTTGAEFNCSTSFLVSYRSNSIIYVISSLLVHRVN